MIILAFISAGLCVGKWQVEVSSSVVISEYLSNLTSTRVLALTPQPQPLTPTLTPNP